MQHPDHKTPQPLPLKNFLRPKYFRRSRIAVGKLREKWDSLLSGACDMWDWGSV
jgi:hypothetical protein